MPGLQFYFYGGALLKLVSAIVVGKNTFLHESELHVMSSLKKDKYWMCFTPYRPEIVGQEESIIFGPTNLHGDAVRIKSEQLGFQISDKDIKIILDKIHQTITKKKYITEKELEKIIESYS